MVPLALSPQPLRRRTALVRVAVALTTLVCAALVAAAALLPAPPMALPAVAFVAIALPMMVSYKLRGTLPVLGRVGPLRRRLPAAPLDEAELDRLRRELQDLPETEHPLGL